MNKARKTEYPTELCSRGPEWTYGGFLYYNFSCVCIYWHVSVSNRHVPMSIMYVLTQNGLCLKKIFSACYRCGLLKHCITSRYRPWILFLPKRLGLLQCVCPRSARGNCSFCQGTFRTIASNGKKGLVPSYSFCFEFVLFVKVPLLEVSGPLAVVQLLETSLLCLVNYARYYYFY